MPSPDTWNNDGPDQRLRAARRLAERSRSSANARRSRISEEESVLHRGDPDVGRAKNSCRSARIVMIRSERSSCAD